MTEQLSLFSEPLYVLWPDGTFCILEEYDEAEWSHKSDDYEIKPALFIDKSGEPVFQEQQ